MSGPTSGNGHGTGNRGPRIPGKEALRAPLPKRFYKSVSVTAHSGSGTLARADEGVRPGVPDTTHYQVLLDDRPIKTPRKRRLALPAEAIAEAVAAEWRQQRETIDPATMPLTRIANSAIDAVADHMSEVAADIAAFAASDLLCYRAEAPLELVARQRAAWDPVIAWAETALGTRLVVASGIMPVEQPPSLRTGVLRLLAGAGPFRLACLHVLTTLTGSALLALAHGAGRVSADEAWAAALIDEDWQIEQWGEDSEAAARRSFRRAELEAAARMLAMMAPFTPP
jgi:chaperone required for assembly of F1-ATPase